MKNTKPTVDTNILIYAHNIDSPFFSSACELLEELIEQEGFTVTSLILFEFYAVITDGRKIEKPLAPKDALAIIRDLVDSQRIGVLELTNIKEFEEWLRNYGNSITRYQIYDANIAFSMQQNGLSKIYTLNTKDFKKFDFIEAINPFKPSPPSSKLQAPSYIPYGRQSIDEKDVAAVCSVLRSDWLTTGPKVAEFEQAIADYVGAKYAVAVSSGTAALHIAVKALGIEVGMEGITSPITFVASSNCMLYNNLKPLFADIDSKTYCINPSKIEEKITSNIKLIIPVHFAGHPCDMNKIQDIARKHNLYVIEDAAHAIGSKYSDGSKVGNCNYSDMTIFSFHPVKTMTTGEGGVITTNNPKLYKKLKLLVTHGITKEKSEFKNYSSEPIGPWYYEMQTIGFNYRITDLQCALGISQLRKIDKFITKRRKIVKRYNDAFNDIDEIIVPCEKKGFFSAYHLYVIQFKNSDRLRVFNELKKNNIGVNVHYIPVHFHPFYRNRFGFRKGDYPIAENYYKRAVTLPLFPHMKESDVEYVIQTVLKTLSRKTQTK